MAIHRNIKTKEKWISQVAKEQSTVKKILRDITSSKNLLIKESDFLKNMKISKDDKETLLFLEAKVILNDFRFNYFVIKSYLVALIPNP